MRAAAEGAGVPLSEAGPAMLVKLATMCAERSEGDLRLALQAFRAARQAAEKAREALFATLDRRESGPLACKAARDAHEEAQRDVIRQTRRMQAAHKDVTYWTAEAERVARAMAPKMGAARVAPRVPFVGTERQVTPMSCTPEQAAEARALLERLHPVLAPDPVLMYAPPQLAREKEKPKVRGPLSVHRRTDARWIVLDERRGMGDRTVACETWLADANDALDRIAEAEGIPLQVER